MKFRIELDGEVCTLDLRKNAEDSDYSFTGVWTSSGAVSASGTASIVEVMPGVNSLLLGHRSFTVHLVPTANGLEVWANGKRRSISVSDLRDYRDKTNAANAVGRLELRAQMPGKVVKHLAKAGDSVRAGQGLIVVEAMKMQNELTSPKDGIVSKICSAEGATVAPGEVLVIVE